MSSKVCLKEIFFKDQGVFTDKIVSLSGFQLLCYLIFQTLSAVLGLLQ